MANSAEDIGGSREGANDEAELAQIVRMTLALGRGAPIKVVPAEPVSHILRPNPLLLSDQSGRDKT